MRIGVIGDGNVGSALGRGLKLSSEASEEAHV